MAALNLPADLLADLRPRDEAVFAFLEQYPFLAPLLVEAHPHIRHYFPDPPLTLRVERDPEGEDHPQLFVLIETTLPVEQAVDTLNRFDDAWWLEKLPEAQDRLAITIDPQ